MRIFQFVRKKYLRSIYKQISRTQILTCSQKDIPKMIIDFPADGSERFLR